MEMKNATPSLWSRLLSHFLYAFWIKFKKNVITIKPWFQGTFFESIDHDIQELCALDLCVKMCPWPLCQSVPLTFVSKLPLTFVSTCALDLCIKVCPWPLCQSVPLTFVSKCALDLCIKACPWPLCQNVPLTFVSKSALDPCVKAVVGYY